MFINTHTYIYNTVHTNTRFSSQDQKQKSGTNSVPAQQTIYSSISISKRFELMSIVFTSAGSESVELQTVDTPGY